MRLHSKIQKRPCVALSSWDSHMNAALVRCSKIWDTAPNPFWKKHLREYQPSRIYGSDLSVTRKPRRARQHWEISISHRTASGIMIGIIQVLSPANVTIG